MRTTPSVTAEPSVPARSRRRQRVYADEIVRLKRSLAAAREAGAGVASLQLPLPFWTEDTAQPPGLHRKRT